MVARLEASIVPVLAFSHTRSQVCAIASNLRKWPAIIRGITLTRKHCANFNCPVGATSPVPRRGVHFMAGPAQTMCKTPVPKCCHPCRNQSLHASPASRNTRAHIRFSNEADLSFVCIVGLPVLEGLILCATRSIELDSSAETLRNTRVLVEYWKSQNTPSLP